MGHEERKHSKFSASGSERWFNCSGSVALSEGLPDKETEWSKLGTYAHEVLEAVLRNRLTDERFHLLFISKAPKEMVGYANRAADFILGIAKKLLGSEVWVETRIKLSFIHAEMFGTFDSAVIDHFGTLHIFDYKYGKHFVSPIKNLQMIFYALGVAHQFHWNFQRVRVWIIQPREKNYKGPLYWEISMTELRSYVKVFRKAVDRVETKPKVYTEGSWCHWCKAKGRCPLKQTKRDNKATAVFFGN